MAGDRRRVLADVARSAVEVRPRTDGARHRVDDAVQRTPVRWTYLQHPATRERCGVDEGRCLDGDEPRRRGSTARSRRLPLMVPSRSRRVPVLSARLPPNASAHARIRSPSVAGHGHNSTRAPRERGWLRHEFPLPDTVGDASDCAAINGMVSAVVPARNARSPRKLAWRTARPSTTRSDSRTSNSDTDTAAADVPTMSCRPLVVYDALAPTRSSVVEAVHHDAHEDRPL